MQYTRSDHPTHERIDTDRTPGRRAFARGAVVLAALVLFFASVSSAQTPEKADSVRLTDHLSLGVTSAYLFNSHTTFEFGSPEAPYQAPLSRLEFPLDSWWGGVQLKIAYPRFSITLEGLTTDLQEADGSMKDSDWLDDTGVKSIYGESWNRLSPSYMVKAEVDLEISDRLRLPVWLSLRPVAGVRYQKFNMVAHDGAQYDLVAGGPPVLITGDAIRFKQTYRHYLVGVRSGIDLSGLTGISALWLSAQLDWAYVEGDNEDHHLMREAPDRFTYERTYGHAWHGCAGLKKGLAKHLTVGLEVDYLVIDTTGTHRWSIESAGIDSTWSNGVKVYSEQTRVSLTLDYRF